MRPRVLLAAILAVLVLGSVNLVTNGSSGTAPTGSMNPEVAARAHWPADRADPVALAPAPLAGPAPVPDLATPAPAPAPTRSAPLREPEPKVSVKSDGFLGWAFRDRATGKVVSSGNADQTNSAESMIKVWIVADYLRQVAADDRKPSDRDLTDASRAIRDSHNGTAERLYRAGGGDRVIERMVDICRLTDTHLPEGDAGWWSRTEMSARDAVRLGECLADGRAAGPEWTDWLLEQMRRVRGSTAEEDQRPDDGFEGGRWGIIDGLPGELAEDVAIKNGWTRIGRTNSWHLNCLAVTDDWVMAVLMRYPAERSLDYGAQRCANVARQLLGDRPEFRGTHTGLVRGTT